LWKSGLEAAGVVGVTARLGRASPHPTPGVASSLRCGSDPRSLRRPNFAGGGANIVAFMSGPGDGAYPTWIGYDAADRPACFVTDFEFLRRAKA